MEPTQTPESGYLVELEQFLESEEAPQGCMLMSELDGYLTGIAVGPEVVPEEEWMLEVWNGEEPVFPTEGQGATVRASIQRRFKEIQETLAGGEWTISPIFWETDTDEVIAEDWAEGFMVAVRLRFDAWEPLFLHPEDSDILLPILALCHDDEGEPFLDEEVRSDELLKKVPQLIPEAVGDIYDYWREKKLIPQPIRKAEAPGRNEACPCGSGKKFKRCCGA
ncbi:uncharacterized protein SAMN05421770_102370 [Granulicella rosea]|uniref:YecA family protein n=1 Tax=Granulicella rosea TaxID=474952 RepID=A0A239HHP0_9BACT|nr:UPF0149 family protein [Granulicella rosea]SNS79784.1 uncharacterized protein SAMN05421770_102370 [Granulicella rosea]